eukprot:GEMP01033951.1.p1 GENE.GEMP01033951.1~~GEMP01033951.1.p1  ORF type:complete len:316 (+),score=43.93 GEMP01033951.1:54-1001(+)
MGSECSKGLEITVGGEKWCHTNGDGQCRNNGESHQCSGCGFYKQNGCEKYPPTTSPDGFSKKKGYDTLCPNEAPIDGNTCIKEKCFGYLFECQDGYVVETSKKKEYFLTCTQGKYKWQKCVVAQCLPRDAPFATPASTNDLTLGRELQYFCDAGYARNGIERRYTVKCVSDDNGNYVLDDVNGCPDELSCMKDPANPCSDECKTAADCGENAVCESGDCQCKSGYAGTPGKDGQCFISCNNSKCVKDEPCMDLSRKVYCPCGTSSDDCIDLRDQIMPADFSCDTLEEADCSNYASRCSWNAATEKCDQISGSYKQ